MKPQQHDAHCKARIALARCVRDRRLDWGLAPALKGVAYDDVLVSALDAIGRYCAEPGAWREGWNERQLGRYHPIGGYDGPKVPYKAVPTHIVHSIMCRMRRPGEDR